MLLSPFVSSLSGVALRCYLLAKVLRYSLCNQCVKRDLPSAISSDHSMYDWNILPPNVVHHDLSDLCVLASIPKKKKVSPLECRLHAPR